MTRDQLCSEIAKRESKKVSISMGNIREIMRILIDMQVEFSTASDMLYEQSPISVILEEADKKIKLKEKKKKK